MTFSVLSIYPILILLAFLVSVFWVFALQRFKGNKSKRLLCIGIGLLGITLAVENSYYLAARLVSWEYFLEYSYMEVPVAAMKSLYIVALTAILIAFGAIE